MSLGSANSSLDVFRELRLADAGEQSLDTTLDRLVAAVANRMQTDVGSIYLLEDASDSLVLIATVGLLQSCVGNLRMQLREGLVGLVAQQRSPIVLARAPDHPRFKYFPEADEDEYQSFLGVPILDRAAVRGVLVVQTIEPRAFSLAETRALTDVAEQLGPRLRHHTL